MHIARVGERFPRLQIQFRISRSFRPRNLANLGSKIRFWIRRNEHTLCLWPGQKLASISMWPNRFHPYCCGIFHCVWNISTSAGSTNNQDCIFHFFRFIAFVHSYITIVLNVLLKITMLTSFMVTTSKRLNYVCPAANRTWQRLTIISCDLTRERDTYFLNVSHIIYLNYYLPRINRYTVKTTKVDKNKPSQFYYSS